ncbi:hypothetical protein TVAG_253640 [Trichomonas vaginalis G3]|uniref:Uncharacterized protein n=1 Tax=Trichomonas vaginalis (strain ATCC PRA-98 / G3) TaxID=412133 RepID=A2DMN1_TRIV3|nr:TRIC channel family [Trichomonas vaginalis G3]EAY18252.1 hypothetical protein TVAG_253640 [Trichomonas vaginalis G3]KAI5541927.1 TRIC channel family [Trichomonas vaginalis G3]|eukprot:XP_001579238.1 hypothetical protein [Trichomonas vaginalis G3]
MPGLAGALVDYWYDFSYFIKNLSKDDIIAICSEYYESVYNFCADMNYEIANDFLFMTKHFPIFMIPQIIYTCILVKRMKIGWTWWKNFLTSFFVIFSGRNLYALFVGRQLPLLESPAYTFTFLLCWLLINVGPYDIFYNIFNLGIFHIIFQMFAVIINCRETTHGVDLGTRSFPSSHAGIIFVALVLSSSEIVIWNLSMPETRIYSIFQILLNLIWAIIYDLNKSNLLFSDEENHSDQLKIWALGVYCALRLIDIVVFQLKNHLGLGMLFTKLFNFLPYHGNDESWK